MNWRIGIDVVVLAALLLATACTTAVAGRPVPDPIALQSAPEPAAPSASAGPAPTGVPLVIDPVIPGWSPVRSVKRAAVYDVPPTWNVLGEGYIVGFGEPGQNGVAGSGAAKLGDEVCGKYSSLGVSVMKHDPSPDLLDSSKIWAKAWAERAYLDDADKPPTVTLGAPEQITTISGLPATIVKADVKLASPTGGCKITTAAVYAVSATGFSGELGPTVTLIVVADKGVPDAAPESEIRQMLTTLRKLGQDGPK